MVSTTVVLFSGLAAAIGLELIAWVWCTYKKNVGLIDIFWGLGFVLLTWVYALLDGNFGGRTVLLLALVSLWGLRLTVHLAMRNIGKPEDHRYATMREKAGSGWAIRNLFTVFLLQGVLLWIVATPLFAVVVAGGELIWLDYVAASVLTVGFLFETVGDWQLRSFKANPENKGKVLDRGLWRYTRHPNYFGDFTVWWGIYLFALAVGAWWTIFAPLIMSLLLMKVTGVPLLEKDMAERRPGYREYHARTNAFFPWFPRRGGE